MPKTVKQQLEGLLREHRLRGAAPPFGDASLRSRIATGIAELDRLLSGGLARGQLSEIHGPASSGRTGVAFALVAQATTSRGALAAWVDASDGYDPASAHQAGVDATRLLWVRGDGSLRAAVAASATLVESALFEVVVLDLVRVPPTALRRLPASTWLRVQRLLEPLPTALVVLAASHTARGPRGISLALHAARARWSGEPGPGRLLRGLVARGAAGHMTSAPMAFDLRASL